MNYWQESIWCMYPLDQSIQKVVQKHKSLSKKISKKKIVETLPKGIDTKMVDVWFQDEARVGQQGRTTRIWAIKGTRPRAVNTICRNKV